MKLTSRVPAAAAVIGRAAAAVVIVAAAAADAAETGAVVIAADAIDTRHFKGESLTRPYFLLWYTCSS